jgi:hypothetical protein
VPTPTRAPCTKTYKARRHEVQPTKEAEIPAPNENDASQQPGDGSEEQEKEVSDANPAIQTGTTSESEIVKQEGSEMASQSQKKEDTTDASSQAASAEANKEDQTVKLEESKIAPESVDSEKPAPDGTQQEATKQEQEKSANGNAEGSQTKIISQGSEEAPAVAKENHLQEGKPADISAAVEAPKAESEVNANTEQNKEIQSKPEDPIVQNAANTEVSQQNLDNAQPPQDSSASVVTEAAQPQQPPAPAGPEVVTTKLLGEEEPKSSSGVPEEKVSLTSA